MLQFYSCKKSFVMLMAMFLSVAAMAQTTIRGTVKDASGGPLPGVSIKVKEAPQIGAVSDVNGNYTIAFKTGYRTLVFSFIGYKTQEVSIGNRFLIPVTLEETQTGLNEVVVLGYNTAKKKDLTGSVAVVSVEDLQKAPVQSFADALAGRVTGVQVSSPDGKPGSAPTIVIRGLGSISQDSSPLYVIDGVPIENPDNNLIDPANIESMAVLKDASATAIYGSRGGNGVIVITTKRGAKGPSQVSYNGFFGINQPYKYMKLLNPYEFVRLASDQFTPAANPYLAGGRTLEDYRNVKGVDLQDLLLRTGTFNNHSMLISGGSETSNYAISGNYSDAKGIVINSDFKRYQGKVSLSQRVGKRARIEGYLNYTRTSQSGGDPSPGLVNSLFFSVYGYRPIPTPSNIDSTPEDAELYDPDNTYPLDARVNPIVTYANEVRNRINKNITANLLFEYNILKGLKFSSRGVIVSTDSRTETFNNSKTRSGGRYGTQGVNGSILNGTIDAYTNTNLFQYNTVIAKKHTIAATAGLELQRNNFKSFGYSAINLPDESLGISGLEGGTLNQTNANARLSYNTLYSNFGQVNYNYAGKYYITGSYRVDGSSKFSKQNRWGYFPSGAVKWKFSEEQFMKGKALSFISDANIRASYGTSGNNRVDDFAYAQVLNFTSQLYLNGAIAGPNAVTSSLPNEALKWETNVQSNIGLDLSFLQDRLNLTVEYYHNKIKDLLYRTPLPGSTGYTNAFRNIASLSNRGWEVSLGGDVVRGKNFTYSSNFNISFNKNRLDALSDPSEEGVISVVNWDANFANIPAFISKIGGPLGQVYGFVFDGIYQYEDFDKTPGGSYILKNNITANHNARGAVQPGQEKYKDLNGDGIINDNDRTVIGNGYPIHEGGWNNNLRYKNFDVNLFFQWSYGRDIINANRIWFNGGQATYRSNYGPQGAFAEFANRWTPNNPSNTIARVGQNNRVYSTLYTEDGSYLRLRTLNIGYTFPKKWMERAKINRLRVYISAANLFTLTGYKGYDPEVSTYATALSPTLDYSAYPRPITITGGINLSL